MSQEDFRKLITLLDAFSTYLDQTYPDRWQRGQTKIGIRLVQSEARDEMKKV